MDFHVYPISIPLSHLPLYPIPLGLPSAPCTPILKQWRLRLKRGCHLPTSHSVLAAPVIHCSVLQMRDTHATTVQCTKARVIFKESISCSLTLDVSFSKIYLPENYFKSVFSFPLVSREGPSTEGSPLLTGLRIGRTGVPDQDESGKSSLPRAALRAGRCFCRTVYHVCSRSHCSVRLRHRKYRPPARTSARGRLRAAGARPRGLNGSRQPGLGTRGRARFHARPLPSPPSTRTLPTLTTPGGHVTSGAAFRDHFRDRPRLRRVPQRACAGGGRATGVPTEPTRVSSEWAGVSFEPRDSEIPGRATLSHRGFRLPITSRKLSLQVGSRRASLLITPKA